MPDDHEQRECPLCGGTMRLKETQTVTQIPGNPKPDNAAAPGMDLSRLRQL